MSIVNQAIEQERLAALHGQNLLDSPSDELLLAVVHRAAETMAAPSAAFSLVDEKRVWLKERVGVSFQEISRAEGFCTATVGANRPQIVEDARASARYRNCPYVTGSPHIRFYAGVPVRALSGHALGALFVLDTKPRTVDPVHVALLEGLAREIESHLKYRALLDRLYTVSEQRALLSDAIVHDIGDAAVSLSGAVASCGADDARQLAARCREVSDKLQELSLSVMRAGNPPAHGLPVNKRRVDLAGWFELLGKRVAGLACRHEIELRVRNDLPARLVTIDAALLERIVVNLVRNALGVLRPGATVLVRGEMGPGGLLTVHVADNGPGIPARERDRIFSSFSRSERSGHGPTGASLLAGRLAAEALGGSLTLMPRSDFGTEFTVSVPIAEFGH